MTRLIRCLLIVSLVPVVAWADTAKELVNAWSDGLAEAAKLLGTVKDKKSADAAMPKLKDFVDQLEQTRKKIEALPEEERNRIGAAAIEKQTLDQEYDRLCAMDELFELVANLAPIRRLTEGRSELARKQVIAIEQAVKTFQLNHAAFPATLDILAKEDRINAGKAYLAKEKLTDPWGFPILYDPAGRENKGRKPDIWSGGPLPKKKDGHIGNWPAAPKPDVKKD